MNGTLLFSSLCLIVGGLLLCEHVLSRRRPALSARLARAQGVRHLGQASGGSVAGSVPEPVRAWSERVRASYEHRLRRAGNGDSVGLFFVKKVLFAFTLPFVPLALYAAAADKLPSAIVVLVLAVAGFFLPDLALREEVKKRREALFLDLPEALSVMALSLRAGQSLRQALELAARDCEGVLGDELTSALSLARRDRMLGERDALVAIARASGEPMFLRFSELLAVQGEPLHRVPTQSSAGDACRAEPLPRTRGRPSAFGDARPTRTTDRRGGAARLLRLHSLPRTNDLVPGRSKQ